MNGTDSTGLKEYEGPLPIPVPPPTPPPDYDKVKDLCQIFVTEHPNESEMTAGNIVAFAEANGLNDAEMLYFCQLIAHLNTKFNAGSTGNPHNPHYDAQEKPPTWCNAQLLYIPSISQNGQFNVINKGMEYGWGMEKYLNKVTLYVFCGSWQSGLRHSVR